MHQCLPIGRFSWKILKPPNLFAIYFLPCKCLPSSATTVSFLDNRKSSILQVVTNRSPVLIRRMSASTVCLSVKREIEIEGGVQQIELLTGNSDNYDGVTVTMKESMDAEDFAIKLKASLAKWKQEGKKGIWIKMPIRLANLVETAVKEGFRYHHAEPDYLMLVTWISESPDTVPANASHRVGIGAFVVNTNREVLVVQESGGVFRRTNVWKLPTGVVNEGEDICTAAVREVKEETGIDTEFVEILAFRQSHGSFFGKSDLFFLCMLRPCSYEIQKQDSEITAAQWMPIQDYVNQPFVQQKEMFRYMASICLKKSENEYSGFSPMSTVTSSGKASYLYCHSSYANQLTRTPDQQTNSP